MSIQIFRDVEEALSREVRRITFDEARSVSRIVLQDTFDPFTGDLLQVPIEPSYYDSSADASNIQYPQFFIRLLKTREDRFTKRVVPPYLNQAQEPIATSPQAFEIVISESDGTISSPGNLFQTSAFQIRKTQVGYLLRLLDGQNIGTYIVSSVVPSNSGPHSIFVSNILVQNLPSLIFQPLTKLVLFNSPVDLNTVQTGDTFVDSSNTSFTIASVNVSNNSIILTSGTPNISSGGKITRSGNIFKNTDPSLVRFSIMDPSMPIEAPGLFGISNSNSTIKAANWDIPIDVYYLIRIDSKERSSHVDILNRMWEEYNPPRSALPVVVRTSLSNDQLLTVDVPTGGSNTITVKDNSGYNIGDNIFILNDFLPTRDAKGNFLRPFTSRVIDKLSTNQLVLADIVPDTYKVSDNTLIVSQAEFNLFMFHFVDHFTKDVEGAQYWSHEFTFWVQIWVDRFGLPKDLSTVQHIANSIGTIP